MINSIKEFVVGLLLLVIFAGILFWAVFSMPRNSLATLIASAMVLVAFGTYGVQIVSKKGEAESGAPADDEFTRLSRVYSSSQAFLYSM